MELSTVARMNFDASAIESADASANAPAPDETQYHITITQKQNVITKVTHDFDFEELSAVVLILPLRNNENNAAADTSFAAAQRISAFNFAEELSQDHFMQLQNFMKKVNHYMMMKPKGEIGE